MQQYISHWQAVNTSLGETPPAPILLQGGYAVADLTTDRAALLTVLNAQPGLENTRSTAAAARDQAKAALVDRFFQLRGAMTGALYGRPELNSIPDAPVFGALQSKFMQPLYDMKDLWTTINALSIAPAFTPPLTLGSYTLATFTTDITALETLYVQVNTAEGAAARNRDTRDSLLPPAKARLVQYKNAVIGRLGRNHPLVASIPVLSPPPGSTPDPVNLSGMWDIPALKARLCWSASENPNLDHYEVRSSPGTKYSTSDEFVVAHVAKTEDEFLTDSGLVASGSSALFKVYVVLTTDNEKGSNAVKVVRP